MDYRSYLRTASATLEIGEVLNAAPDVLLGVTSDAEHTLGQIGIRTVSDLANSATFAAASAVIAAADGPASGSPGSGELPGDLFVEPPGGSLAEAPQQPVSTLRLVTAAGLNGALAESLDISTVRDLAVWPPYLAARAIADAATVDGPTSPEGVPADLLPMSGRYPTERAYYSSFVLSDLDDPAGGTQSPLESAGALDPVAAITGPGFTKPVRGARLTFRQSWYSQGVALGQLLHSLALAPGESTRVAMIDWSRQESGAQTQQSGQTEQVIAEMTHKRAMSEVQDAVAREAQDGFSQANTQSSQTQVGGGGGLSIGPLTVGGSAAYANAANTSATVTGTSGVRNVAASMSQNVADVTHQAASSARNLYASVVREVSQSEHEAVSTRVVANYNHMHALTVQYYEVVQVYRTSTVLHRFEPCLFVPMKPIDFAGAGEGADVVIHRYRAALTAAALDDQTRTLLAADSAQSRTIAIRPTVQQLLVSGSMATPAPDSQGSASGADLPQTQPSNPAVTADNTIDGSVFEVPDGVSLQSVYATFPCRLAALEFVPGAPEGSSRTLNPNIGIGNDGQPFQSDLVPAVPLADVAGLTLDTNGLVESGQVQLVLAYQGAPLRVDIPVVAFGAGGGSQVLTVRRDDTDRTLRDLLAQDALRYSQAVWQAMDSATISAMLSAYAYAGQPLAQVVDPQPVGVSGNYLIFRMPAEGRDLLAADPSASQTALANDTAWQAWIAKHADYETSIEDFVPLPSGGVFAEAVLGRANSAELLDITRFWNWQDSPIPLQPSEIAPVQTGSRATGTDLTPAGFAAPIVTINNPTPLPDPAGLSAVLGAVSNGSLFRDMSGSALTQALATAALANAGQGATSAGSQAQAYAAVAAQKEVELAKVAAGLVTGGLAGGGGTVSEQGARINEGRALDARSSAAAKPGESVDPTEHETRAAEGEAGTGAALLQEAAAQEALRAEQPTAGEDGAATPGESSSSSSSRADDPPGKRVPQLQ